MFRSMRTSSLVSRNAPSYPVLQPFVHTALGSYRLAVLRSRTEVLRICCAHAGGELRLNGSSGSPGQRTWRNRSRLDSLDYDRPVSGPTPWPAPSMPAGGAASTSDQQHAYQAFAAGDGVRQSRTGRWPLDALDNATDLVGSLTPTVRPGGGIAAPWLSSVSAQEIGAYRQMARLHNIVPSFILVLLGAWAGSGRGLVALHSLAVLAMALVSSGVAVASCVINDYFDWASGVDDKTSSPDKPLPAGLLRPELAVLFAGALYIGVLITGLFIEQTGVRAIIALSAGATLLYTPLFKRMTFIKNITVAIVIALTPIAGALVADGGVSGALRMLPTAAFTLGGILHREILMDISDAAGDAAAGVRTLPVLLGPVRALQLGAAAVSIAATGAICWLMAGACSGGAAAMPGIAALVAAAPHFAAAFAVAVLWTRLLAQAVAVRQANFSSEVVSQAVEDCKLPVGLGIILLSAMACFNGTGVA